MKAWFESYRAVCSETGVSLAPPIEGSDKSFDASKVGTVLGVEYNLNKWTWTISEMKLAKILVLLYDVIEYQSLSIGDLMTISGKLSHYYPIFQGRYERGFFLQFAAHEGHKTLMVDLDSNIKSQAKWWVRRLTASKIPDLIPDPRVMFPAGELLIYTDASGGGSGDYSRGYGGVVMTDPLIFHYYFWEGIIANNERSCTGDKVSLKMTFLEGVAALAGLLSAPSLLRNRSVIIYTDNSGLVHSFAKGSSRCLFAYSIVKAIFDVARGLNIKVQVLKVKRCSNFGSISADSISKGKTKDWMDENPGSEFGYISRTLVKYLQAPFPTRLLGQAILRELSVNNSMFSSQ